jgi:hypothetical protein
MNNNSKKDGLSGVVNVYDSLKILQHMDIIDEIFYDIDREYVRKITIPDYRISKSKRKLFELRHALEKFDEYVYKSFPECVAVRLGIPQKISDCKNLNDDFKEEYYHMLNKKVKPKNDFDGDIINTILHFRKNPGSLLKGGKCYA